MPNWLKNMLGGGAPPGVFLGAFGKHPGWDDHIEPIGLDSEALLAARDILYVRGIGGVINEALWEKKPDETLPQIAHLFSWNGESDTLIGRMWSSVDGKGRARYPMVAVAHVEVPFSYSLAMRTSRVLSSVEARCRQAATAAEVRAIFASGVEELACLPRPTRRWVRSRSPDRAACSRIANGMGLNEGDTFARVLYALEPARPNAHAPKGPSGKISLKLLESPVPAQQYRLPMDTQDSIDGIAFWEKVVTDFTRPGPPTLFIHPTGLSLGRPRRRHAHAAAAFLHPRQRNGSAARQRGALPARRRPSDSRPQNLSARPAIMSPPTSRPIVRGGRDTAAPAAAGVPRSESALCVLFQSASPSDELYRMKPTCAVSSCSKMRGGFPLATSGRHDYVSGAHAWSPKVRRRSPATFAVTKGQLTNALVGRGATRARWRSAGTARRCAARIARR